MTDQNINNGNWNFNLKLVKAKQATGEQPLIIKDFFANVLQSLTLKIMLGINDSEPQTCGQCKQKSSVLLRWYVLLQGNTESAEIYCYQCGGSMMSEILENPDKLKNLGVEITTENWQERFKEIKGTFDELWTTWKKTK